MLYFAGRMDAEIIILQLKEFSVLEGIAALLGVLSVWFSLRENILVYPTGIVSVLIYVFICFYSKIYADAAINLFYFAMSIYGWYNWQKPDENKMKLRISSLEVKNIIISILAIPLIWVFIYIILRQTDTDVAELDAATTSIAIVAMFLMAKKKIENWIFWITCDLISIPLYAHKEMCLTAIQFLIFTVLAVIGYFKWKQKLKNA